MKLTQYGRHGSRRVIAREPVVESTFVIEHVDRDRVDLEIANAPGSHATLVRLEMTRAEALVLLHQLDAVVGG